MPSKFNLITFITLTVFGTVTAITVNAQNSGSHIGIAGGLTIPDDSDIRGSGINSKVDFDETASGSILAGHAFENGLRGEFELTGRKADVDDVSGSSAGTGEVQVWNVMANIIYDFQSTAKISPYLGAGIGYAIPDYDGVRPVGGSVLSDSNGNLAYQGIAGVGYKLSRRFTLFSDYRYFGIGDVGLQTDSRADVDAEYREHRLTVGLRWTFSGPPEKEQTAPKIQPAAISPQAPVAPPKPAEAAPAMVQAPPPVAPKKVVAPRAYLVFFDWNTSKLTSEGQDILRVAADNSKKTKVTRIVSTGHADSSGPANFNLKLSIHRADSVRDELIKMGVPADIITVVGKGETELLIPTANGVREPQNRRVEIVLE